MAAKLKKGDKVVVLAGKDKGKQGEISSVNPSAGKAVVDGAQTEIGGDDRYVAMCRKHFNEARGLG